MPKTLSLGFRVLNPIKWETGLRPNSAGIPYTLLFRIEALGFPTFGLLLYMDISTSMLQGYPYLMGFTKWGVIQDTSKP